MLLHVLCQVCLLRVGLSTELADVCLEVFGLLVFGDVLQQSLLVDETLVTRVALVRLVSLMTSAETKKSQISLSCVSNNLETTLTLLD